jgi:hypothetical protein
MTDFALTQLPQTPRNKNLPQEVYEELQTLYKTIRELEVGIQELQARVDTLES